MVTKIVRKMVFFVWKQPPGLAGSRDRHWWHCGRVVWQGVAEGSRQGAEQGQLEAGIPFLDGSFI